MFKYTVSSVPGGKAGPCLAHSRQLHVRLCSRMHKPWITKINLSLHPSYQQLGWQENWETYPFERPLHFALLFSPQVSSFMKKAVSSVNPYNWGCEHNSLIKIVSIATLKTAFEGVYLVCSTADRLINFCLLLFCDLWFVFLMHFEF